MPQSRTRRRLVPNCSRLDARLLMTAAPPVAAWIGQDGHDLAGGSSPLAGNGVQDMHFAISNLPSARAVVSLDVLGDGGGEWKVNLGQYNMYNGAFVRSPGATTADLYLDPYQTETGRRYFINLNYDDGTSVPITASGGAADPNLRMPLYAASATWVGQDGKDLTGPGPGVGPDGVQDVHVTLSHLFPGTALSGVTVRDVSAGVGWAWGLNPGVLDNAELLPVAGNPSRADLYFNPIGERAGHVLSLMVAYADGKLDQETFTAGHANPALAMPRPPAVSVSWNTFDVHWLGQDGIGLVGAGDVHLALGRLPAGRTVASATLSDQAGVDWSYARPGSGFSPADPNAMPLGLQTGSDPTRAELGFPPVRDETGASLTLTLTLDDSTILASRLAGGAADPGLREPGVAPTSVVAHPGDDLADLANRFGTVRLVAGLYFESGPLVLNHPVTIAANPGATLLFSQGASDPAWTSAIKVMASHTTLSGFAVRFAGPIRWNTSVGYGPAVIGATDNFDPSSSDPRLDLTFARLDLKAPPGLSSWEEAPHVFRLANAGSGKIIDNVIEGGATELFNGPWHVTGNSYLGTLPNTFANEAISAHYTHDVTIANNVIAPTASTGKTWRFLAMTQSGFGDVVRDNTVVGVGPMDSDTVPNPNAPEVILTEAYRLHYEGIVASVSPDGLVVQTFGAQGGQARTGDVLSILSGPQAGRWRMIAQVLAPTTYLLDGPITPGKFAVSLSTGFVNETYQRNTIDARGSSSANELVLAGNQFGARVLSNHFLGGNNAFQITAYPTESPNIWGWSHAPFLGAVIQGNTLQDTLNGGLIDVLHNAYTKADARRVYFSGSFVGNTGIWSAPFLLAHPAVAPQLVTVGDSLSADPGELVLSASGNIGQGPASGLSQASMNIVSAWLNGAPVRNQTIPLASSPGPPVATSQAIPNAPASSVPVPTDRPAPPTPHRSGQSRATRPHARKHR